ncbi:MAG: division/cell wall cluster transcriptional repressor MraZ [Clostridia bacterium]
MLIGQYQHSIDIKGRLIVPAKFREDLGDTFIVTKGLDNCLFIFHFDEWKALEAKIRELPFSKARDLQRFFFSGAIEVELDKQGRILLPQVLRDYASLTKDITVIGAQNRAEIWNSDMWNSQNEALSNDRIAEVMEQLGF